MSGEAGGVVEGRVVVVVRWRRLCCCTAYLVEYAGAMGHFERLAFNDRSWQTPLSSESVPGNTDGRLPTHAAVTIHVALGQPHHARWVVLLRGRLKKMVRARLVGFRSEQQRRRSRSLSSTIALWKGPSARPCGGF